MTTYLDIIFMISNRLLGLVFLEPSKIDERNRINRLIENDDNALRQPCPF